MKALEYLQAIYRSEGIAQDARIVAATAAIPFELEIERERRKARKRRPAKKPNTKRKVR